MTDNLTTIYNLYVDELFTYGIYLGFEREVIKDAIHDIFVKISTDRKIIEDVLNMKFYLFKSLKNRLIDIHKNTSKQISIDNLADSEDLFFDLQINIEDVIIEKEESENIKHEIEKMLNSLSNRQREVIYLRYVHEYNYTQISELMQISVHGCRKLVSKAISVLRKKYGPLMNFILAI